MDESRLSYATVFNHGNGIIETIVDEGIEIDVPHFNELVDYVNQVTPRPRGLIVDRRNAYSFTFKTMLSINNSKILEAVAVVNYKKPSQLFGPFTLPKFFRVASFETKEEAIEWLLQKLEIDNLEAVD